MNINSSVKANSLQKSRTPFDYRNPDRDKPSKPKLDSVVDSFVDTAGLTLASAVPVFGIASNLMGSYITKDQAIPSSLGLLGAGANIWGTGGLVVWGLTGLDGAKTSAILGLGGSAAATLGVMLYDQLS